MSNPRYFTYGYTTSSHQTRASLPSWHDTITLEVEPSWDELQELARRLEETVDAWVHQLVRAHEEVPF